MSNNNQNNNQNNSNNNNNNNKNKHSNKKRGLNKGGKKHGKKSYYSSGIQGMKNGGHKKNSKTLFIGKIYMEDIQSSEVSTQLIEHRVSYLLSVLEKWGEVEHHQNNIENNGYMLVTYKTRETAERVLKKLRNDNEMENLMDQIKVQLGKNKIPSSVCPSLNRYKYDWSDKPASRPKNAYSMKKSYQKEEETVAELKEATETKHKKKKSKKKPKRKYQKKTEENEIEKEVVEKKEEPKKVQIKEKKPVDAEDLRREADKAKLKDELEYLSKQLENVEAEISAENKRCKDRDVRISKLEEELRRVDKTKSRLERQLSTETRWKKLNQEAVSQLTRELEHIRAEQQSATLRLTQSESLDQTQSAENDFEY